MILGLMGYAGAGKDAFASVLVNEMGFKRVAFADPVRRAAYNTGWDGKKDDAGRRRLQEIGMHFRELDQDYWLNRAIREMAQLMTEGHERFVFTDCRFPNEVEAIRELGGKLLRIKRDGVGPVNEHVSEVATVEVTPDGWIENNGTLSDLRESAIFAMRLML